MSESVRQDLPVAHRNDRIELRTSEDQALVIRKAAELVGWTVPQFVLSAALDRAERDLYEHAVIQREAHRPATSKQGADPPATNDEPFTAVINALGWAG